VPREPAALAFEERAGHLLADQRQQFLHARQPRQVDVRHLPVAARVTLREAVFGAQMDRHVREPRRHRRAPPTADEVQVGVREVAQAPQQVEHLRRRRRLLRALRDLAQGAVVVEEQAAARRIGEAVDQPAAFGGDQRVRAVLAVVGRGTIEAAEEAPGPVGAVEFDHAFGFLRGDDPRALRMVDAIATQLRLPGGLLRRYDVADDFGVPEAAFTVCSFWLAEALAMVGRRQEGRELFEPILKGHNGLGLFAEDILVADGTQAGNFPQTYSHVGLINAAFRLSRDWD